MNKEIMKAMGFLKEVERVENHQCPFCAKQVTSEEFINDLSRKEFEISGLCQKCQDEMFG